MTSWLLLINSNNVVSGDGDLYACTDSAWASVSKFIALLLEECWGLSPQSNEYSGVLKGYVCIEGYRYIWFNQYQYARPSDIEVEHFSEGSVHTKNNSLIWFFLPRIYRQFTHHYVDLKHLLLGRVPFKFTTEDEILTQALPEGLLLAEKELYLVTDDSKDLLFYCIQSQHLSVENVVTTSGFHGIQESMIAEFPHHPFRCISVMELCNIPTNCVSIQLRAMTQGAADHYSDEGEDDVKHTVTSEHIDISQVDVSFMLKRIKDETEAEEGCQLTVREKTQLNIDEQQLVVPQETTQPKNLSSVKARTRNGPYTKVAESMSYGKLLSISKSYGQLAAAKQYADRKLWGGSSSRVSPSLLLQCPGCSKVFPPCNPKSLWNMLMHMRNKHKRRNEKLLSSVSDVFDILIPFMQKKIAVWNITK